MEKHEINFNYHTNTLVDLNINYLIDYSDNPQVFSSVFNENIINKVVE